LFEYSRPSTTTRSTVWRKRERSMVVVPWSTIDSICAQREASLPAVKTRPWVVAA
jgi:hypothetical protein